MDDGAGVPPGRAFRLTLAYDGTNYCGWQRQPDQVTIQSEVERAVAEVLKEEQVTVYASSRTDAGVHALGQSAAFRTYNWPAPPERLPLALNTKLPPDIVARAATEVPLDFHPLRDSTGKRYRYRVYQSRIDDPLTTRCHWWIRRRASLEAMIAAAKYIEGKQDFYSFQSAGSPRHSTIRHVRNLTVSCQPHMDGKLYTFDIEADGFLYNMVRNIVGTLLQVGVGREPPEWVRTVLDARDRRVAGAAAPPQGLTLMEVLY